MVFRAEGEFAGVACHWCANSASHARPCNAALAQLKTWRRQQLRSVERYWGSPARLLFRKNARPRCRSAWSLPREHNKAAQHTALIRDALLAIDLARPWNTDKFLLGR